MKYKLNTLYEAFVDTGKGCHRMHFRFFHAENVEVVEVRDVYDAEWKHYAYDGGSLAINHTTEDGTWVFRIGAATTGSWLYWKDRFRYSPGVSVVTDDDKHFNNKDDTVNAFAYSMTKKEDAEKEVKQALDWWRMVQKGENKMSKDMAKKMFDECTSGEDTPVLTREMLAKAWVKLEALKPTPVFKNITEGGNDMRKSLYHVILFNRKTEKIDFKAYIPATGEIEAGMTAAHDYAKYDGKVHQHIVKLVANYNTID